MIPVEVGLTWRFKKLGTISLMHPACGQNWDCTVEEMRQKFTIFLIGIITTERRYLFSWEGCDQTFAIVDKADVAEYRKQLAAAGGIPVAPDIDTLVPIRVQRPIPVNLKNCLFVILAALLMFLCGAVLIGIGFIFPR